MIVRELFAAMGVQVDESSVKKADAVIDRLKSGLLALGTAWVGWKGIQFVQGKFEEIANTAASLQQLAQKTGMGTEALQELQYAAKQAGVDAGALQMGLIHLGRSAFEAATQGGAAGAAFSRLGIEVRSADGKMKPIQQLLGEVSDKLNAMPDGTEKAALSIQILSRSGAQMIPLLDQGSKGIAKWGAEARKTGGVMSDSLIKQGVALYQGINRLQYAFTGLTYAVLGPFVSAMTKSRNSLAAWIETHRTLISLRVQQVVGAIGQMFAFAAEMAQRFTGAFVAVGAAVFAVLFPVTSLIAALALLAEDIYSYTQGRDSLFGRLLYWLEQLQGKMESFGFGRAIIDAFRDAKKSAEEFFAYLDSKNPMGAADSGPKAGLGGSIAYMLSRIPGIHALARSMDPGVDDPGAFIYRNDIFGGGSQFDSVNALRPVAGVTFQPIINVTAGPGTDGHQVGADIGDALVTHQDLQRMLREAAPH